MIAESQFVCKDVCMHVSESPSALIGFSLSVSNFVDVCGPRKLITNSVSVYVTSSSVSFHMYVCIHEVARYSTYECIYMRYLPHSSVP